MQAEEGAEGEPAAAAPSPAPTPSPAPAAQPSPAPTTAPGLSPAVLYLAPSAAASPAPALAAAASAPSPAAEPSPAPAAEAAAEAQPRIGSKVVLPSPGVYDPRCASFPCIHAASGLGSALAAAGHGLVRQTRHSPPHKAVAWFICLPGKPSHMLCSSQLPPSSCAVRCAS